MNPSDDIPIEQQILGPAMPFGGLVRWVVRWIKRRIA